MKGYWVNRMKGFLVDTIAMAVVAFLVLLFLNRSVEAILVFGVGLFGLRQVRRFSTKKSRNQEGRHYIK